MNKQTFHITLPYLLLIIAQLSVTKHICTTANGFERFSILGNVYLRKGDIILSRTDSDEICNEERNGTRERRHAIKPSEDRKNIWVTGVPYYFDISAEKNNDLIREFNFAVQAWQKDTCVNFTKIEPPEEESDHLVVTSDEDVCASHPGRLGGKQPLILGKGCESFGHIAHELGHALGLFHTMSRHDRDRYITVKLDHVDQTYQKEFDPQLDEKNENFDVGYDFGSIMHYPWRNAFSKNEPVMIPNEDDRYKFTMGSEMISFADFSLINELYSCKEVCKDKPNPITCQNGGYPHPRNCSRCLCPGGYGGDDCTHRPEGCGEELQAEKDWNDLPLLLQNYNVRDYLDGYKKCNYWIKSAENTKIEVKFLYGFFHFENDGCAEAGVEIKTNEDQTLTGYRLCSEDAHEWTFTSSTNLVPIITYTRDTFASVATISYRQVE